MEISLGAALEEVFDNLFILNSPPQGIRERYLKIFPTVALFCGAVNQNYVHGR